MRLIPTAHQQGGVGLPTLALNLAHCLSQRLKVAVTDADPQGSRSELGERPSAIPLVDLKEGMDGRLSGVDVVLIGTPPYLSNRLAELFTVSDYASPASRSGLVLTRRLHSIDV